MLKRLLCLLLAAALPVGFLSCRGKESTDSGSAAESTAFPESPVTGEPGGGGHDTSRPAPDDSFLVARSLERLILDGNSLVEGDISAGLEAVNHTVSIPEGKQVTYLELTGWAGYTMAVDAFGYSVDGGDITYGLFATHTEEEIRRAGGEYARRFTVTIPLLSLKAGTHTVRFLVRLADGTVVPLMEELRIRLESVTVDPTVAYHSSVTSLGGDIPEDAKAYEGRGGNVNRGVDIIDATLDGVSIGQNRRLTVSGWLALEGGVERYVWSADGVTWYPAESNGETGEPSVGHFASLGYENAASHALMNDLTLDLTPCAGRNAAVTVGGVPQNAPDRVVPFLTVTGLEIPIAPADIDFSYLTYAHYNDEGIDLASSDLRHLFDVHYGAGDLRHVTRHDGELCYCYAGIHSFQTQTDGCFAITAKATVMTGCSFLFVRATKEVRSVDEVPIPLHAFYETDGTGLCGGAGIYAQLSEGVVTLVIKALDPGAPYRIRNCVYRYSAEGERLTLADDGYTVYVLVDGREITRVTVRGQTEYPEHFERVAPYVRFASSVTLTLPDGKTETIRDTLVASTVHAHCGVAVRGGTIHFTELSVLPFSEAGIRTGDN